MPEPKNIRILIVEDDPDYGLFTKIILERTNRGYQVDIADTPQEGLDKILAHDYDLVVSDYRMPALNAMDILKKTREEGKDVPFIVVTASGNEKVAVELMKAGAYDYVIKDLSYKDTLPLVVERSFAIYKSRKDRQRLEKKIIKAAEEWEATFNSIADAISIHDTDFNIFRVNKSFMEKFKIKVGDIKNKKCHEIVHDLGMPPSNCPAKKTIETKKSQNVESYDASRDVYFEAITSPIFDDSGELSKIVHILRDITERKRDEEEIKKAYRELKSTQNKLVQSEKLAAIGRFSSGIAHEVKNPLGVILSGAEFLESFLLDSPEEVKTGLSKIKEATIRADTIIRNLLKFARPSEVTAKKITSKVIVEDTLSLIKYRVPSQNIRIDKDYPFEEVYIKADKSQLEQVMFNLVSNSIEAMAEGGVLDIKVYAQSIPEIVPEGKACVIEVSDTGEGISKEGLAKIFEPFYTTKREKKGTGLGLYMSKIIVNNHHGELLVNSEKGKGTTSRIVLPVAQE